MRNTRIENIINNFTEQYRLYEEMAICAGEQLTLLTASNEASVTPQVMNIIAERQKLMEDLQMLDSGNKNLQKQITIDLGISEFTLSQLQNRIVAEQYGEIKDIVMKLGAVLKSISDTDRQNQALMRTRLKRADTVEVRTDNKEVAHIYKQAMDFNKERSS